MFVNTRVLCVLLKPGADKCNHYSIIFSFCTISFKILTCHLCPTSAAAALMKRSRLKPETHRSPRRGSPAWLLAQPGSFVTLCEKQTDDWAKWFFRAVFGMARSWQNVTASCFGRRAWSWCTISPSLWLLPEWLSRRETSITSWLAARRVRSTRPVVTEGDFVCLPMTCASFPRVCDRFLGYNHLAFWARYFWRDASPTWSLDGRRASLCSGPLAFCKLLMAHTALKKKSRAS